MEEIKGKVVEPIKKMDFLGHVVMVVAEQPNAKIEDYYGFIVDNGDKIAEKDKPEREPKPEKPTKELSGGEDIGTTTVEAGSSDFPSSGGGSYGSYDTDVEEDEESKKKKTAGIIPINIGACVGAGIALLGFITVLNTKQVVHETAEMPSDYAAQEIVSDTAFNLPDNFALMGGAVVEDPGKIIHDIRYSNKGLLRS